MRRFTLLTALFALSFSAISQNIYIQFDAQCMDKLEYRFVQPEANNMPYTAYRLNKNDNEKLYFETGIESVMVKKTIPGKLIPCNQTDIDKNDISDINKGKKRIYICKKLDSGWAILPVGTASYMYFANNYLTFQGPDYDFKADFSQPLSTNNLSDNFEASMSSIFYAGQIDACTQNAAVFSKSPNETCKDESVISILPSVGLIQDKSSSGQIFELMTINGMPVCDYVTKGTAPTELTKSEPQPESIPTQYSSPMVRQNIEIITDAFGEEKTEETTSIPNNDAVTSKNIDETPKVDCNLEANEGEHLVGQGESLYGIARRYGLSVNNIRSWNELTTDNIFPCTIIKVIAPPVAEQPSMTVARTNDVPMNYNEVAKPENLNPEPAVEIVASTKIECNVDANEGEHVIQQGESLYAIARKYNLKVNQLRTWNNLESDRILPCSKLVIMAPVVQTKAVEDVPKQYSVVVKPKTVAKAKPVVTAKSVKVKTKAATKTTAKKTEEMAYVKTESCLHIVREGESLESVAKEWGIAATDLRQFNNLSSKDKVLAGQVLRMQSKPCYVEDELPENYGVVAKPKSSVAKKDEVVPKNYSVVIKPKSAKDEIVPKNYSVVVKPKSVNKEENIPTSYNTVMPKPIKVKDTPEGINEGVVVTTKSPENRTRKFHVVKSEETLTSIAKAYGISVEKLRSLNKLESNELIIPNQLLILE